uniref:Uncharacterized protein n=1 Tax=Setaria italica TaxID=4555 RepID=K4A4J5_SETIT
MARRTRACRRRPVSDSRHRARRPERSCCRAASGAASPRSRSPCGGGKEGKGTREEGDDTWIHASVSGEEELKDGILVHTKIRRHVCGPIVLKT